MPVTAKGNEMEDLKLLIEMVSGLPSLAIWVLAAYLAYKVAVVGSIYGVIRLLIIKGHDLLTKPKTVALKIGAKPIDESTAEALNAQIARVCSGSYYHMSDIQKLREALDAKLK
jgi:hypothetical protein